MTAPPVRRDMSSCQTGFLLFPGEDVAHRHDARLACGDRPPKTQVMYA